jgi:hypothetical protein
VPWTVPAQLAINESQYIFDYARGTIEDPQSMSDWLSPIEHRLSGATGLLFFLLSGSGLVLISVGSFRARRAVLSNFIICLSPIGIGFGWILFALFKGPSLRFYSGGAFMLSYTICAFGISQFNRVIPSSYVKCWSPGILCFLLVIQGCRLAIEDLTTPTEDWPQFDTPDVITRNTNSGIPIFTSKDEKCWDAPLPCTPYFDATLQRIPWLNRFYFVGHNTIVYRNWFPSRVSPIASKRSD